MKVILLALIRDVLLMATGFTAFAIVVHVTGLATVFGAETPDDLLNELILGWSLLVFVFFWAGLILIAVSRFYPFPSHPALEECQNGVDDR